MILRIAAACGFVLALAGCNGIQEITGASGSTADVTLNRRFSVTLSTSPAVSLEYAYSWGHAKITGDAVTFERTEADPKVSKAPGSHGGIVYIFKAAKAGTADIVIPRVAGSKAPGSDYTLQVRVK